jgi:hypothetical protein
MKSQSEVSRNAAFEEGLGSRNPFGVMDVPHPNDLEVARFTAIAATLGGFADANAEPWGNVIKSDSHGTIEGNWSSRWNGGADPTIPEDAAYKWKRGSAEARIIGERVYLLFDWDRGARRGLIDALRESANRLVGKYINLSNTAITRPWVGFIVSYQRIDGRWPQGRLDFRR